MDSLIREVNTTKGYFLDEIINVARIKLSKLIFNLLEEGMVVGTVASLWKRCY